MMDDEMRSAGHALLCVVALMDESDTTSTVKVHLDSMPSLAPLFTPMDGRAMYLNEAVRRWVDMEHADEDRRARQGAGR